MCTVVTYSHIRCDCGCRDICNNSRQRFKLLLLLLLCLLMLSLLSVSQSLLQLVAGKNAARRPLQFTVAQADAQPYKSVAMQWQQNEFAVPLAAVVSAAVAAASVAAFATAGKDGQ